MQTDENNGLTAVAVPIPDGREAPSASHTPTPWRKSAPTEEFGVIWAGAVEVARSSDYQPLDEQRANAAFIVKACNEHERLRDALRKTLSAIDALMADGHGVAGLHRNDDVATWDELVTGGRFESRLSVLDEARAALSPKEG